MHTQDKTVMSGLLGLFVVGMVGEYALITHITPIPIPDALYGQALSVYAQAGPFFRLGVATMFPLTFLVGGANPLQAGRNPFEKEKDPPANWKILLLLLIYAGIGLLLYQLHQYPNFYQVLLPVVLAAVFLVGFFLGKWIKLAIGNPPRLKTPTNRKTNKYSFNIRLSTGWLNILNPFRGVLVIGANGSGKSASIAVPVIQQSVEKQFTGLIYDFKFPELSNIAYDRFVETKTDVKLYVVNFVDLSRTHRCNPITPDYLTNTSFAEEASYSFIANLLKEGNEKPDFWIRSCTAYLTGIIWYLRTKHPQYCTLPHVIGLTVAFNYQRLLEVLQSNDVSAAYVRSMITAIENKAGEQLSGVVSTLQVAIAKLYNPEFFWVLSGDDFNLDLNSKKDPKLLCIGTDATIAEALRPVVGLICTVATKLMNKRGKRPSLLLLDEFPTLFIPRFDEFMATARSRKCAPFLLFQDFAQGDKYFGHLNNKAMIATTNTQIYGKVSHLETAKYVSDLFGTKPVVSYSKSTPNTSSIFSSHHSTGQMTQTVREEKVIYPQDVMNLDEGEFVGLTVGNRIRSFQGKAQVKIREEEEIKAIPSFSTNFNVKENYERILAECGEILSLPSPINNQ